MIHIRVNGVPAPQGSKRHVGNGRMVESSRAVGPWREAVRWQTQAAMSMDGWQQKKAPVMVSLLFTLPRPRGHYGTGKNAGQVRPAAPTHPQGKPDLDKLTRAVLDGITAGGAIADDALVVSLDAQKRYPENGAVPGADIWIMEAE